MSRISRLILAASRVAVSIRPAQRCEVSSSCDWLSRYEACMIVSRELLRSWARRRSSVLISSGIFAEDSIFVCADIQFPFDLQIFEASKLLFESEILK